jgi:hypothetical protein
VTAIPQGVLATRTARLEVETLARTSAAAQRANLVAGAGPGGSLSPAGPLAGGTIALANRTLLAAPPVAEPVLKDRAAAALEAVDKDLVEAGIIDKVGGDVAPAFQAELGWERTTCLPTQAVVVKGCLDACDTCEEARKREKELDLKRKDLENRLLARQIELLEKSQEYRCCPSGVESEPVEA